MDDQTRRNKNLMLPDRHQNGLLFGIIAGLWLAIGIWGLDAYFLCRANGDLPFLKLILGTPVLIVLAGIAGWLTARLDNAALGAVLWLLTGIVAVWISSHIPFEGLTYAIGVLEPEFAGLDIYPFVESTRFRMGLLFVIVGVFSAISGGLELLFIDSASSSYNQLIRIFRLAMCFILFLPMGLFIDNLIHSALRLPIQGTDRVIQLGLKAREGGVSKEIQREMGLRSLIPFGDDILSQYRLTLGYYDPETLEDTIVYPNFSGVWGMCSLIGDRPFVCWLSAERYLERLACLVQGSSASSCDLKLSPGTDHPQPELFANLDLESLKYGILGQRGTAILTIVEDRKGDQVECILRDRGAVYLERCNQVVGQYFDAISLPFTPTPPAQEASTPTEDSASPESSSPGALLPREALLESVDLDPALLAAAPYYDISLKIASDLQSFDGIAQIDFTNQEDVSLEEIYFRLFPNGNGSYGDGTLNVTQINAGGDQLVGDLSVEDTVLRVGLPRQLQPGEKIELEIEFQGKVPVGFGGGDKPSGYGIYNFSDGVLALSGWYPILAVYDAQGWNLNPTSQIGDSVYSDTALFAVSVALPKNQVIAATGVMTGHEE